MGLRIADLPSWRAFALTFALLLVMGAASGVIFAAAGVYNVAASKGHWAVTRALLEFGMQRSVDTHSLLIEPPDIADPDMIALGAGHYRGACAPCHGGPGFAGNPIAANMLPPPPRLEEDISELKTRQIFWIVKHGLKYTGMPAWPAQNRDDEVWSLVAFLQELDGMGPDRFRLLTTGNLARDEAAPVAAGIPSELTACMRCHESETASPVSALVPKLAGQNREYLVTSLRAFATGERESGIMQPVAAELDQDDIERLADFYSRLQPTDGTTTAGADTSGIGKQIARNGRAEDQIPACQSCHGKDASPQFPRLAGQPERYLREQLRLWKNGLRQAGQGAIMAPIANRMNNEQIAAVAQWYASIPLEHSGGGQ